MASTGRKSDERLRWLQRATPPTPGRYTCTMPDCVTDQQQDGFCPVHPGLPLRLQKNA